MKRYLVLENGSIYSGTAFGSTATVTGELVFTTGMTGYQEAITDPSYHDQILTFTSPLIGNYGINLEDNESQHSAVAAIIIHELARKPSNWRSIMSLESWAKEQHIPGLSNIDTRALTQEIRDAGVLKAAIVSDLNDPVISQLNSIRPGQNAVDAVTAHTIFKTAPANLKVAMLDFGHKTSILRELTKRNIQVTVFPPTSSLTDILASHPDGIMLSNGPGNPEDLAYVLPLIQHLQALYPLMAICLGHQLFALANGAKTYKMKFGHRGFNHAVRHLPSGKIRFTSQNHGFAVDEVSLAGTPLELLFEEINDHTVEGLQLKDSLAFSVQYHPDSAPGPHDMADLFDLFVSNMLQHQQDNH